MFAQGKYWQQRENGSWHGNPVYAGNVRDLMKSIKNQDGRAGVRNKVVLRLNYVEFMTNFTWGCRRRGILSEVKRFINKIKGDKSGRNKGVAKSPVWVQFTYFHLMEIR